MGFGARGLVEVEDDAGAGGGLPAGDGEVVDLAGSDGEGEFGGVVAAALVVAGDEGEGGEGGVGGGAGVEAEGGIDCGADGIEGDQAGGGGGPLVPDGVV